MSHQDQFKGFALELYASILNRKPPFDFRERIDENLTFATGEKYPQLQAADFAAYHLRLRGEERQRQGNELLKPKGIDLKLVRMMKDKEDLKFISAVAIQQICERYEASLLENAERAKSLKANRAAQRKNVGQPRCL